jgi:gliding motility-associated-like protein
MFKICLKAFATLFFLSLGFTAFGQGASNKGTDFWLGYGKHTSVGEMSVYITSDVATTATVSIANLNFSKTVSIPANGIVSVDIPKTAHLANDGLSPNGIHITSLKPIIVYAHIYANSVSGATLVLPVNALGKDYYSINYKQISNSNGAVSWFFVVAVEDNTEVEITPSEDTKGGLKKNTPDTITLNKGEIYNVLAEYTDDGKNSYGGDLTGSHIKSVSSNGSCKKIAVFSGSSKISINCLSYNLPGGAAPGSADNLIQQAYPTDTWGKNFITIPQKERNFVIYRIVKSDPTAVVKVNGTIILETSFTNNSYYDFASQQVDQISADKPIQVVQYAVTQKETINCGNDANDVGDPEMIYLNPLEQTLTKITMYSTREYMILKHFINVVIKNDGVPSFIVDGQSVSSQFRQVPNNAEYSYAQLSVSEGTHNLSSNIGFNAIAYGFGAAESYGYAAGANLTAFGIEPVSVTDPGKSIQTGCIGSSYDLTLKLPYQASQLQFDRGDGNGLQIISSTSFTTTQKDDKITYVYSLIPDITYSQAKTYSYQVVTTKPSADACGSGDEFLFDFIVNPKPVADFSTASQACLNSPISFRANKIPNQTITEYLWDFNGDTTVTTENATHIYTSPGKKINRLSVKSDDGCWSDVKEFDVEVVALPVTNFSQQRNTCIGESIQFTDESTSATNHIVKWQWDFGDSSSTSNSSTVQNPTHIFSDAKTYTVTLKVTTDLGCESEIKRQVKINPLPIASFETPDICLDDASALFTNTSTAPDGSALSYLWDFGDGNATLANNSSTLKNPTHVYTQAAVYNVSLTVTSTLSGCATTITKPFTVNGSTPKANFAVQNESNLCSDQEVIFEDLASVDFGEITKIEWIYDASKPSEIVTDNNPAIRLERSVGPKFYKHLYPSGFAEESKAIDVIMNVFSGTKCVSSISKTINLKNTPNIVFNSLPTVCAEILPFKFTQANETIGLNGTGVYSGDGIEADGLFSPTKAGVGTHTITYTFIADNGCSAVKTQDITVFATPTVDAGTDKTILIGGETPLEAKATGKNLTYKWTPSTGLNRDDILDPIASPTKDIVYTLLAKSEDGCILADDVAVKVLEFPEIPNTFTPNGDGVNDTWNIKYLSSYPNCTIKVFNRDGKEVFSAQKYVSWDGKLNGTYLPEGMYYYMITAKSGELKYSGSLLLVK